MGAYGEVCSKLIDELRAARETALSLVAVVAGDPREAAFMRDTAARIADLLDDLGCCDD